MALREKLEMRVQPLLEPHETVRQVFMAQSGPSPYWIVLTWFTMLWNKYLIVAVTDDSLVTFKATAFKPSFVKSPPVINRYPRAGEIGPCSGLWSKITLEGDTFHVHKRFHKDIAAADASRPATPIATGAAPAAGVTPPADWYPDPKGEATHRYWDGSQWTDNIS